MYAVVSHYSFDEPVVALFKTCPQAQRHLINTAKEEYRIATEENGWDAELTFDATKDKDIHYAKLVEHFTDHDDITEFSIASLVYDPRDDEEPIGVQTGNVLVMSTAHLREETFQLLDGDACPISFVNNEGYGTVVRITNDDFNDNDYPEDLVDCMEFAHWNGCEYIRFDGDGPLYELPTYEWD